MLKLKDLKGKFEADAIFHASEFQGLEMTLENSDAIAEIIKKQVEDQGCTDFKREGDKLYFGNQFFMLPKIKKLRHGVITFRSADYIFDEHGKDQSSYGNKVKASQLTEKGFVIETMQGGKIEYVLKNKIED